MKRILIGTLVASLLALVAAPSFAQDPVELLRADLRANKTALVTEAMGLDSAQSDLFWPIYREYEAELTKINDNVLSMVKDYAANYDGMTDVMAKDLMKRSFKVREDRMKLLKKYVGKAEKSLNPRVAARWAQVEYAMQSAIDLQMASELPLMKK